MYNYLKQWSSQPTYLQNKTWLATSYNKVPWGFCFGFYSVYIYIYLKQWSLNQSKFKDWKAQTRPLVFCRHLVHLGSSLQQTRVQVEDITCQQSGYLQNMMLLMLQKSKKQQLRFGENPQKTPSLRPTDFFPQPGYASRPGGRRNSKDIWPDYHRDVGTKNFALEKIAGYKYICVCIYIYIMYTYAVYLCNFQKNGFQPKN